MKAVMISIQPKWVEKIASGEKTIEVRKTAPKIETPFKCYIYETKTKNKVGTGMWFYGIELKGTKQGVGKVIGEFVCDKILKYECSSTGFGELSTTCGTCLTYDDIINYCNGQALYGWHISNLKIYDKPKEISEFRKPCSDKYIKKYKYCQGCKHGLGADLADCWNTVNCPPQSWFYVEELKEN